MEKVIKVSLHRRWKPTTFLKLCIQFQETHENAYEKDQIAQALFACNPSIPLDDLFVEYIAGLINDVNKNSLFSLADLLTFLHSSQSYPTVAGDLLIYLGNCINIVMTCDATSQLEALMRSTSERLFAKQQGNPQDTLELADISKLAKGLSYFAIQYMKYHPVLDQQASIALSKVMQSVDPYLGSKLNATPESFQLTELPFDVLAKTTNDTSLGAMSMDLASAANTTGPDIKTHRASQLVWLEAVFPSRARGESLYRELDTMFGADNASSVDVVLAKFLVTAFDCIAVALQNQDAKAALLWKHFIGKRYPVMVYQLRSRITNIKAVLCEPIAGLDRSTIDLLRIYGGGDALDEMFSSFPSTTSDVRHDLLQAAYDLNLIGQEDVSLTLKETSDFNFQSSQARGPAGSDYVSLPESGSDLEISQIKYRLESEVESDSSAPAESSILFHVLKVFEDLDGLRQNEIAVCIRTAVNEWIRSVNVAALGRLCMTLTLLPDTVDILFLHIAPAKLGAKLAEFLNTWTCQEDDLQEPYADYGRIYIFCQFIWSRYELDNLVDQTHFDHLKLGNTKYQMVPLTPSLDIMSEEHKNLLGGWISALFDSEGIGDDLMRMSTANDILSLVPCIFQQVILAVYAGILDIDTVKGGVEYFSQPFLLPSLLDGFRALGQMLEIKASNPGPILKIIHKLMSPGTSLSKSSNELFDCVMSLAGPLLRRRLSILKTHVGPSDSNGVLIDQLLGIIEKSCPMDQQQQLQANIGTRDFSTLAREVVSSLTAWTQACDRGEVSCPPRHLTKWLNDGIETVGPQRMLSILLDELDYAESIGSLDDALEIVVMLIDGSIKHTKYNPLEGLDTSIVTAALESSEEDAMSSFRSAGLLSGNLKRLQLAIKQLDERKQKALKQRLFPEEEEGDQTDEKITNEASAQDIDDSKESQQEDNNQDIDIDLNAGLDAADVDMGFAGDLEGAYGDLTGFDDDMMLMDL